MSHNQSGQPDSPQAETTSAKPAQKHPPKAPEDQTAFYSNIKSGGDVLRVRDEPSPTTETKEE